MDDVNTYRAINNVQKRDALEVLAKYSKMLNWIDDNTNILDIGSGDGGVTCEILKKYVPSNFKKLIGCDCSEKMVNYANEHYRDEKTEFLLQDIQSDMPKEWTNNFNHIFSFYVFHWVKNMQAYQNIYNLLRKNGECLLMFLGYMPIYNVFRELSYTSKWSFYLENVESFVSLYHDEQDPTRRITKVMKNIGFRNIRVKCERKSTVYSIGDIKGLVTAINIFDIPDSIFQDFLDDFIAVIAENRVKDIEIKVKDHELQVLLNYDLIIVFGSK